MLESNPVRPNCYNGRRASDGAEFLIKKIYSGWVARRRDNSHKIQAGDILTATTLAGIELRLAQS